MASLHVCPWKQLVLQWAVLCLKEGFLIMFNGNFFGSLVAWLITIFHTSSSRYLFVLSVVRRTFFHSSMKLFIGNRRPRRFAATFCRPTVLMTRCCYDFLQSTELLAKRGFDVQCHHCFCYCSGRRVETRAQSRHIPKNPEGFIR